MITIYISDQNESAIAIANSIYSSVAPQSFGAFVAEMTPTRQLTLTAILLAYLAPGIASVPKDASFSEELLAHHYAKLWGFTSGLSFLDVAGW